MRIYSFIFLHLKLDIQIVLEDLDFGFTAKFNHSKYAGNHNYEFMMFQGL